MKVLRFVCLACLFAIPFVPLVVEPDWLFPFVTGKAFAFRVLVLAALLSFGVLAAGRKARIKVSPQLMIFGALLLVMVAADLLAPSPALALIGNYERMGGFTELAYLGLFFMIAATMLDGLWDRYIEVLAGAATVVSLGAIAEHFLFPFYGIRGDISSTLGNPSYLGEYATLGLFFCLYAAKNGRTWLLAAAVQIPAIYLSDSRGALLAVCAGLGLYAYLQSSQFIRRVAVTAILGIVALMILDRNNLLWVRTAAIANDPRVELWTWAWHGILQRPWLGWGHEGFHYLFAMQGHLIGGQPFDRAHNLVLDWLVQGGVFGCAAYLALIGTTAWGVRKEPAFLAFMLAYAVNTFFVFDTLSTYIPLVSVIAFAAQTKLGREAKPPALSAPVEELFSARRECEPSRWRQRC